MFSKRAQIVVEAHFLSMAQPNCSSATMETKDESWQLWGEEVCQLCPTNYTLFSDIQTTHKALEGQQSRSLGRSRFTVPAKSLVEIH